MARKLRVQYPGAVYHIMSRGNQGHLIFREDRDRELWLETLGDTCAKTGWQIHAYVLMGNHYHLLAETPEANLVAGMKWLQGTYTRRFNLRHRVFGHLLQGRYKAVIVDGTEPQYFGVVSTYIHLNPVRAGLVQLGDGDGQQRLTGYPWSSYPAHVGLAPAPGWLRSDRVLGALGFGEGDRASRRGYEAYLESRALECGDARGRRAWEHEWRKLRRGWYLGGQGFRAKLLEAVGRSLERPRASSVSGEGVQAHGEAAAEQWLTRGMNALGWKDGEWERAGKRTARKQLMAWWLRSRTAVSCRWISGRLAMGHESSVSHAARTIAESRDPLIQDWRGVLEALRGSVGEADGL
jgi:REP element-mobilizing transposase RayT